MKLEVRKTSNLRGRVRYGLFDLHSKKWAACRTLVANSDKLAFDKSEAVALWFEEREDADTIAAFLNHHHADATPEPQSWWMKTHYSNGQPVADSDRAAYPATPEVAAEWSGTWVRVEVKPVDDVA